MVFTGFGSDNHAGVHPEVLAALSKANDGFAVAYGDDQATAQATQLFQDIFGKESVAYFVYNGTAANILGLRTAMDSFHAVFCSDVAHLWVHECCGPESFIGGKLVTVPTPDGKLTVDALKPLIAGVGDVHMAQPRAISLTEATERGTVYTPGEIRRLADFAHSLGMVLHMDGARLCNAAASLHVGLNDLVGKAGVDILSFGGTKNGMMFGEAIVVLDATKATALPFYRKQGMQLASKMRYISAQFQAMLGTDLWLRNAVHANAMASLLAQSLEEIPEVAITQKVETNMVFATLPETCLKALQDRYFFHRFDERTTEVRLVCSFQTAPQEVHAFAADVRRVLQQR